MSGFGLLSAFVLDLLFGDPRRLPHPVEGIGWLIHTLEDWCYEAPMAKRLSGGVLVCGVLGITWLAGWLLLTVAAAVHPWVGGLAAIWLAWTCLAARELHRQAAVVIEALVEGDLVAARGALGMIVGRDTAHLDEPGILRACVETVAENTSDGVVAPLFYLALGGPLGGLLYKAVNTMDSMVGYRNERYREFGSCAARLDDLLNWLPARLTGLLMVAASFLLGLNGWQAWRIMRRDARKHASPNAGYPEAAAAGALGVSLGGRSRYFGRETDKPVLGDADHEVDVVLFGKMVYLMYAASLLALALAILVIFFLRG